MTSKKQLVKGIGRALVAVLLFNALSPLSVLAREKGAVDPSAQRQLQQYAALNQRIEQAKAEKALSPADRIARDFRDTQDVVRSLLRDARARNPAVSSTSQTRAVGPNMRIEVQRPIKLTDARRAEQQSQLKQHLQAIREGQGSARAEFAATGQWVRDKHLPAEILTRHDTAVAQFEARAGEFDRLSQAWLSSGSEEALAQLDDFFKRYPAHREAAPFDPKKLPWSTPKPTTREPATTRTAWFQNLWGRESVHLAQATSVGPINFQIPPEPGQTPNAGDLAETPETQQTAAIKAKASELGNNPVAIHNWVRNNVEWVPTWGAIQSAEDTLNKKRGNAHDTASLEIALLRAANIPARYQYGTIEITAEQAQNWVGGVNVPQAAQQLMGQGGIANRALVSGGKIAKIQLEHVWVQAYVNWAPSRGAKQGSASQHVNPNGPLNAWVSLDPSFKQYTYNAGMDLKTNVPLDANAVLAAAQQGATVNQGEGWVQNLNQTAVQSQLADYQKRLKDYIDGQNSNATVGAVIGKKIIPVQLPPMLAGAVPYTVVQQGSPVQAVPTSLQHKFTYRLYASLYDRDADSPLLIYTEKTSQLVGKRLTLSYLPATQADADTIASYLPKPHSDGSPIEPSEFPASMPGYLIKLRAQITLDGQVVVAANQALIMGTDLYSTGGFTQLYDPTQWDLTSEESNVAGNVTAIGISAGGLSVTQLRDSKARLQALHDKLKVSDLGGLRDDELPGEILGGIIQSWFASAETQSRAAQFAANVVENPGLSYGLAHTTASPTYSWGIIRKVSFPGTGLDIGHIRNLTWDKNNSATNWAAFNRFRGQEMSWLEASVPERFFADPAACNPDGSPTPNPALPSCAHGISAVSVIGIANQLGQKVFRITQDIYQSHPDIVYNKLAAHSPQTLDRIQQALDVGYEVTVHESPISQGAWRGAGFILIDPATGSGAYLIEGGANGNWLDFLDVMNKLLSYVWIPKTQAFGKALGVAAHTLDSIGFFGNLFSATLDLIEIGSKCGDQAIGAVIAYLTFTFIFWTLAAVIGSVTFGMGLIFGVLFNAIMDFLVKPQIIKECEGG